MQTSPDVGSRLGLRGDDSLAEHLRSSILRFSLVVFVRIIEGEGQPLRLAFENDVQRELAVYARAVGQRMAASQDARYADASGDLRLSSGRVRGYLDFGRPVPAQVLMGVLMGGMIVRAGRALPGSPWELPARWRERRAQIDLGKPLSFVLDAEVGSCLRTLDEPPRSPRHFASRGEVPRGCPSPFSANSLIGRKNPCGPLRAKPGFIVPLAEEAISGRPRSIEENTPRPPESPRE